ncbi:MAG TPA: hypothetical protein VFW38_05270 [Solirubrobacteraceae bacterium]|nr:hypothetical protein [Solirubrobacteraceae bacterium]
MSTALVAAFVLFVILGIVASLGGSSHYDRIGESYLPEQPPPPRFEPGLEEEARQLVLTRNERRRRQGEAPLDVEAEVRRTLAELDPGD